MAPVWAEFSWPEYQAFLDDLAARGLSVEYGGVREPALQEVRYDVRRGRARQRFHVRPLAAGLREVHLAYDLTWPWRWQAEARIYRELFEAFFAIVGGNGAGG